MNETQPEPATPAQLKRLRELASDYGLPPDAIPFVEAEIAEGPNVDQAYALIRKLGGRIAEQAIAREAAQREAAAQRAAPPPKRSRTRSRGST